MTGEFLTEPGKPEGIEIGGKEVLEKAKKLFGVAKALILAKRSRSKERAGLEKEKLKLETELAPELGIKDYAAKFESSEELFNEIKIIDDKILDIEKQMGMPIDFFDQKNLEKLLGAIAGMRRESFLTFKNDLDFEPDLNSGTLFWALKLDRLEDLELNYPARLNLDHFFACRLVGRLLLSQIKQSGIEIDARSEAIILKALPFTSQGDYWTVENEQVDREARNEIERALFEFYKLPQSEQISKVAKSVSEKLKLLDLFRTSDESIVEQARSRNINLDCLGDKGVGLKEFIRKVQDGEDRDSASFFGHTLPYALRAIRCFYKK